MARRERERYTERNRPHRRGAGESSGPSRRTGSGSGGGGNPLGNPVVLVAVGGLILAGILALGIWLGRRPATPPTASGTPTVMAETTAAAPTGAAPTTGAEAAKATAPAPPSSNKKTYSEPVDQKLDATGKSYFATIETPKGPIVMELWPQLAPRHVSSFVFLAREGYFDGLTFHRVEPGFVIQGGDPQGNGQGGPGYSLPGEFNADNPVPHRAGTLAMARTNDPNSAGSQFYIVTEDSPSATALDKQYTVFGHVVKGMDVVKQIAKGDVMTKVTIAEKAAAESQVSPDDIRQGKLPANN